MRGGLLPAWRRSGAAAPPPDDRLIGADVIGQYVIRRRLGSGAMGAVYLADQVTIGRQAAIKVLHPSLSRDPATLVRFGVEARAASQLSHPNIVTIYNYGAMADGTLFLAMEYVAGRSLEQEVAGGPLAVPRAISIASQIAAALGEAHRKGVIHRDVKPSNVMLTARGEATDVVKVLDFGVAQIDGGGRMTATGFVCGTPRYMSPEQLKSRRLDGRSDLYSLACVLFELLAGRPPFEADNALGFLYKHLEESPPLVSRSCPRAHLPPAFDAFLVRAMGKSPADRPPTAAAFIDAMHGALRPPPVAQVDVALVPGRARAAAGTWSSLFAALRRAVSRVAALRLPEKPSRARRLFARLTARRSRGLGRLARRLWRTR